MVSVQTVGQWLHFHIMIAKKGNPMSNQYYLYGFEDAKQAIEKAIQKSHDAYECSIVATPICSCELSIRIVRSQNATV
jgi:hypothetical protein